MTTAVAAGVQASVVTAHGRGEVVKSGWGGATGSGPTSVYLSRSVWRINSSKKKTLRLRVRRVTRCEASGRGFDGSAEEAHRNAAEAARAVGEKADQVLDGVNREVGDFQERTDVQGKARRAAQNANLKFDDFKTEITQRLGIDEPLSQYMVKKGKKIRYEVVCAAESACNGVVAISNMPVVRRCIFGFLLFYAFSIAWAARILYMDKKSEEAREQFGRDLRLQKLRDSGSAESTSPVRASVDITEINVNGRKVPSANDEEIRVKVKKIQEMARAVRASENEVFSPAESGFVSVSGKGPVAEPEKQQSSLPNNGRDLLKRRKQRKQVPVDIQDKLGLENSALVETVNDGDAGNEHSKLVREPESPLSTDPLKPIVVEAESPSANAPEDTRNVGVSETLQSKVVNEDLKSARSADAQVPLQGDVVPSLNGSSKPHRSIPNGSARASSDGKPTPSTLGGAKLPSNGNSSPNINGTSRPVPPVSDQPIKFKAMRVITSPEEARARLAARKAKDGNSSAKGSSANSGKPKFPRINMPAVESALDELETDPESRGKDDDSVAESSSSSQKETQEPKSEEQEEEEAWLRDEVLRNIVLKVRDNEEAGRDSFHGLESEEEQRFFKGLERKFEREGDAVKTWIQDRVENLDYGIGGVGLDDPPEKVFPRWKDPENPHAKKYEKFKEDRKRILEQHMGISTPSQADRTSSASTPSSSSSSPPPKPSSKPSPKSSSSSPSSAPLTSSGGTSNKDESRERLQSNRNASGSKTVVTTSGKQPKPVPREWQHTKKWAQELQQKYDRESDPDQRVLIEEIGQDLDRWITEEEIEEAQRLLSRGVAGEEEYVRRHYEKTREKIKKQHEMFGSEGMLNKYSEYKETKEEPELWWLDLPFVCCIGLTNSDDGETSQGFYSLDMTPDFEGMGMQASSTSTYNHTIAFQDPKDAANFCGLLISEQHMADVIPLAPKDLYQDAKQEGFKVTVVKKGQLGLVPGQALDDVEQRLIELGSAVYWKELERMRSIDIDSVLDEGLGYGRPSR
ncbi:hypothetical protein M758_1G249600 [Ceratodon purpureus]|nr:hypothetical protein M758_1G249600 [Ceratodon purpureus]